MFNSCQMRLSPHLWFLKPNSIVQISIVWCFTISVYHMFLVVNSPRSQQNVKKKGPRRCARLKTALGSYVRRWLPFLSPCPTEYIHRPWELPMGRVHGLWPGAAAMAMMGPWGWPKLPMGRLLIYKASPKNRWLVYFIYFMGTYPKIRSSFLWMTGGIKW